jgi:hypothetical protein
VPIICILHGEEEGSLLSAGGSEMTSRRRA